MFEAGLERIKQRRLEKYNKLFAKKAETIIEDAMKFVRKNPEVYYMHWDGKVKAEGISKLFTRLSLRNKIDFNTYYKDNMEDLDGFVLLKQKCNDVGIGVHFSIGLAGGKPTNSLIFDVTHTDIGSDEVRSEYYAGKKFDKAMRAHVVSM